MGKFAIMVKSDPLSIFLMMVVSNDCDEDSFTPQSDEEDETQQKCVGY